MNRLDNRIALITGAAQGIGAATAALMARAGASVLIGDVQDDAGRAVAESIRSTGGNAGFVHLDVTSEGDWQGACDTARREFGGLDILVNNAGVILRGPSRDMSLEDWRRVEAVNIDGVFLGTRACAPLLRERAGLFPGGSAIVNVSSIMGLVGSGFSGAYSMSKGAVRIYTKSAALEFAQAGMGIRVNSVHPGFIDTDMAAGARQFFVEKGMAPDVQAAHRMLVQRHPLGRLGTADDIAHAIVFLASDDAAFVTGSELVVDGGYTAQ
jgi:NAD(P)-dependent dehydrogenase (short-subunit alcohol dehydrogenase family)